MAPVSRPAAILRRRSDEKSREIIDAGRRVIFREGIWNTTTRKIAEEAGISLAAIHYYFANKDDLLVAVYEEMIDSIRSSAGQDFATPGTLAEHIEGVVDRTWQFSKTHMDGQLMQAELTVYALRNGLGSLAVRQGREYLDIYVRVLKSSVDAADRDDLDIDGLAQLLLAGIDGLLIAHLVDSNDVRSAQNFRRLAQVALHFPLTSGRTPLTAITLPKARTGRTRRR
jgi:AcrR family transcriptional regulator